MADQTGVPVDPPTHEPQTCLALSSALVGGCFGGRSEPKHPPKKAMPKTKTSTHYIKNTRGQNVRLAVSGGVFVFCLDVVVGCLCLDLCL